MDGRPQSFSRSYGERWCAPSISKTDRGLILICPLVASHRLGLSGIGGLLCGDHLTFLVTSQGQPFSDAGFTNWFRDRCNEAGLPKGLSAHGLRKARARRIAERGGSAHEIAAVTGHTSIAEVQRYAQAANRRQLAARAMRDEIDVPSEIKKTGA